MPACPVDDDGVGLGEPGRSDGGVLPSAATRPEPAGGVPAGLAAIAASIPSPSPPMTARIPSATTAARFIARRALDACVEPLESLLAGVPSGHPIGAVCEEAVTIVRRRIRRGRLPGSRRLGGGS